MDNKNSTSNTLSTILFRNSWSAVILAAALTMSGCASVSLSTIPSMPAAEGHVRYGVTKNGNTLIVLNVKHLAHPEKLTPPANNYVVWTRATKNAPAQNIGALKVDNDLAGELETEIPLKSFELFITAEASGQVQQPSGESLLWTNYSR